DPEVLGPDVSRDIFPAGIGQVAGRVQRMERCVAERAAHPDAEWAYELGVAVIIRIVVVAPGVPLLSGRGVERRVGEQAQADDAAREAIDLGRGIFPLSGSVRAIAGLLPSAGAWRLRRSVTARRRRFGTGLQFESPSQVGLPPFSYFRIGGR